MTVSAAYADYSGTPIPAQALVSLPQGRRSINIAPPGGYRTSQVRNLDIMFDKTLFQTGGRQVQLSATVFNVLQAQTWDTYFTTNFFSPSFATPSAWGASRNVSVSAKMQF